MITAFRLALNEIGKFTSRRLPRLALLAFLIIPLLYSSLYLYANSDPYGNMKNLPVAVVNNDKGATSTPPSDKLPNNMGAEVIKNLEKDNSFNWQVVDNNDYEQKVINGEYAFALVIDDNFTENVYKLSSFEAVKTNMKLLLNDANSYVLHEIAGQVKFRVTSEVSSILSQQVIMLQLAGLSEIHSQLVAAADGAGQLASGLDRACSGADQLKASVDQFTNALVQLNSSINELNRNVKALPDAVKQLKNGADQLKNGLDQVSAVTQQVYQYEVEANQAWQKIASEVKTLIENSALSDNIKDSLLTLVNTVDARIGKMHSAISQYVGAISQLDTGASALNDGLGYLSQASNRLVMSVQKLTDSVGSLQANFIKFTSAVAELSSGLKELSGGAHQLEDRLRSGVESVPNLTDAEAKKFAEVAANPITFDTTTLAPAGNYAAGLAPFFMALAGWIGVYILFVLMQPISTRALISNVSPWKVALGGWLPLAAIGVVQMVVMLVALHFIVGLAPVHAVLTMLFLFLMVLTYLTIVHFLVTAFGKVGLFIGLVLMIVQLTTAGGTFPWQTMPAIDQVLYQVMPMSHSVDALRNLIYGGSLMIALQKSLVLVAYLVTFGLLDVIIVRIRRRWSMKMLFPAI
ncbi:MAG: YhgE/Pip domain-containing protein [Candidatus Nomurabacteria bacterium]|jgi:putative membrane protein|nr:YhgE/Pip domain-containing protein [Candidatus Nomurabacteria bacterium]